MIVKYMNYCKLPYSKRAYLYNTSRRYTVELLKDQYTLHTQYVKERIQTTDRVDIKIRLPSIPEDITENMIKYILHNKLNDITSEWNCKIGDLHSLIEGVQECKCFTSDGPISFTPSSNWNVIYFLDARNWLNNKFILYKVDLTHNSNIWNYIKVNKKQTFRDQANQGRRPRVTWKLLHPQIINHCNKIFEGTFEDIFVSNKKIETICDLE